MDDKKTKVPILTCKRCSWRWIVRQADKDDMLVLPKRCAKCRTPLWNTERRKNVKKHLRAKHYDKRLLITAGDLYGSRLTRN